MDIDDALALISEERPYSWLQYHDGSWAPVWRDGHIGPSFTIAELIQLATNDIAALDAAALVLAIDVETLVVLDAETRENWPPSAKDS